jgi:hypothetical protein
MSTLFSPNYIKDLTQWRRNRIKNYSIKKSVSFEQAIEMLLNESTAEEMVLELDCTCDKEFHSKRMPRNGINNNTIAA